MSDNLGSAGERGTKIDERTLKKYLVEGYLPTIGIECHVQLNTATKLFSSADNDAREADPNAKISAIDYALPGMLPVLNREAIVKAARAGRALHSRIANESRFDRKHYFYPDLPKGYQISQMYQPIILGGWVELPSRKLDGSTTKISENQVPETAVRIHHAHLEEDAGKLTHFADYSLVDLNRAGTPLIEIVSEPDIHSAVEAREYAEELHGLMTFAGVTFGDLYYGNMRFDVNISIAKPDQKLGIRTEVKNLNSFRAVEKAVEYEIARQIELLESDKTVIQETRGWNDATGKTTAQRGKENAQDYRYMPDADIPPVVLTDAEIREMQKDMPILPPEFRAKFAALGVDASVIAVLLRDSKIANLIAEIIDQSEINFAKNIVNLFVSTLPAESENEGARDDVSNLPSAANLIKLAQMFASGKVSSTAEKEIFAEMLAADDDPETIATKKNLLQNSNADEIAQIVAEVLASSECAKAVADFRNGQEKVLGFLVGQVMKTSRGQANPALAQKLIREKLAQN